MRFDVLTLFPDMIESTINDSILKRAIDKKIIEVNIINFRAFSDNKHLTVDDYAYSGGKGMLIRFDPIVRALKTIPGYEKALKILTTPSGVLYNQERARNISTKYDHIIIICGHYEGIDARILNYVDLELSIGDYILTGGELAASIIIDSVSRLIPGVISEGSTDIESFENNLLEYPQYTRPQSYDGYEVPEILISGHHANIKKWQHRESLKKTYLMRPDLLEKADLSAEDKLIIEEIKNEEK